MVDLENLLARDHRDLEHALDLLATDTLSPAVRREALVAARLGFAAHAEAEATVLFRALVHLPPDHAVSRLTDCVLTDHARQESLLLRLAQAVPSSLAWARLVRLLRSNVSAHGEYERVAVLPSVRVVLPAQPYTRLASAYATERLRALRMLSAVVATPQRRRAETMT